MHPTPKSWRCASPRAPLRPATVFARSTPRSMQCSNAFRRFHPDMLTRLEQLRELCMRAGDKASLATGMAGLVMEHIIRGRQREASQLAAENMALIESIGDPNLTVALTFTACVAKFQVCEMTDVMRWAQNAIDLADGESAGNAIILGSPLSMYLAFRGVARWVMGQLKWREDIE